MNKPWYYLIVPYVEGIVTKQWLEKQTKAWKMHYLYDEYTKEPTHYFIRFTAKGYPDPLIVKEGYHLMVRTVDEYTMEQLRKFIQDLIEVGELPDGTILETNPSINPRQWILEHGEKISSNFAIEPLIE